MSETKEENSMTNTEIRPNTIYTLAEVCELLQISPATALRWIREGRLPSSRIGRGYRFLGSTLLDLLQ